MGSSVTAKLAKRLDVCDKLHTENIETLKRLKKEASTKFDGTNRHIRRLKKQLDRDPENKKLQKEYAAMVNARAMYYAAHQLNDGLLEKANERS